MAVFTGTKYFRTQQGYLSPKERKKTNKKIEVDYHELRQARLAKDFHQVDRTTWEEAGILRRLGRQKDNSGSFTICYILNSGTLHIKIVLFILSFP